MAGRQTGSFRWIRDPGHIADDLGAYVEVNIYSRAYKRAEELAKDVVSWMQANARWEDQTGEARNKLTAIVQKTDSRSLSIVLSHGVGYGVWLELMNAGEFAILSQAVAFWTPQVTDRMKR